MDTHAKLQPIPPVLQQKLKNGFLTTLDQSRYFFRHLLISRRLKDVSMPV
nr:MAG TPA: hypothetical protein [Caudoviricetes sp.]